MKNSKLKGWLYLLPAIVFLGIFMVYPLVDVLVYSVEEGYNFVSRTAFGYGLYNYSYVLHDPYFLQAVKNTFIISGLLTSDSAFSSLSQRFSSSLPLSVMVNIFLSGLPSWGMVSSVAQLFLLSVCNSL